MKLKYSSWLILLVSVFGFAQNKQIDSTLVNLSNPNATIYTHLHFLQPDSYQPSHHPRLQAPSLLPRIASPSASRLPSR